MAGFKSGGNIIFLHGASSSGKSTLAKAVQARLDQPFWRISIDHLRDSGMLPAARIESGEFAWSGMREKFFDGFHRSLAAYAAAGNNLILEHILDTEGWLDDLVRLFRPFDVFFVGLHCSPDELARREQVRGDREIGSARRDAETIHEGLAYDLELSSENPPNANAERLIAVWRARRPPLVFERLASA